MKRGRNLVDAGMGSYFIRTYCCFVGRVTCEKDVRSKGRVAHAKKCVFVEDVLKQAKDS